MTPEEAADVICQVLGLNDIEIEDNFFDLGGNSFKALELIEKIKSGYQVTITLADLTRSATPSGISRLCGSTVGDRDTRTSDWSRD